MAITIPSYRDRTSEFSAVVERLKRNQSLDVGRPSVQDKGGASSPPSSDDPKASTSTYSEFNKEASRIGLGIHEAAKKVARLSKLAKRSSMFDDPAREIQDLTAIVTQDITGLNTSIQELESVQGFQIGDANSSKHSIEHCKTILTNLKGRLVQTTNDFKEVLTVRTENLKLHENRKQLFTAAMSSEKGSFNTQNSLVLSNVTETTSNHTPPPWAKSSLSAQAPHSSTGAVYDTLGSTQLRRRTGGGGSFSPMQTRVQMQQEVVSLQDHSRSSALHAVESTITELSGMFTQVATMVSQQGELAIRIDDNMDDTLANVEGAQGAFLKYLHQVSSNRWLILKIFFVLMIFLMIFIIFVA